MTAMVALENKALRRALVINSRIDNPFMTGVIMERISELKRRMRREVVKFAYLKKDKSVRVAYGTLMPALVGDHINGRGICGDARKVCTYFDVECGDFRCFQLQALIQIW